MAQRESENENNGERHAGILQDKERGYLNEHWMYNSHDLYRKPGDDGGRFAKSRIINEVTTVDGFEQAIKQIRSDLWAIHLFRRLESNKGQKEWENSVLPMVKEDLVQLRDQVEKLIDTADNDETRNDKEPLKRALGHLGHGLAVPESPSTSEDLVAEAKEFKHRHAVLYQILCRSGATDILEFLHERERTFLPKRRVNDNGQPWKKVATDLFVKELGIATKEERTDKYQITDRGKAVAKAWLELKKCEMVETHEDNQANIQNVVRRVLEEYFDTEAWTPVDFEEGD